MARLNSLKKRIPRKKSSLLKKKRISKKERFVANNNNTLISDEQIKKCNDILVDKNKNVTVSQMITMNFQIKTL